MKSIFWILFDFCVYLKNYKQNRLIDNFFDKNQGGCELGERFCCDKYWFVWMGENCFVGF